jgi:hypothetical protein
MMDKYGDTPGQLGAMKEGELKEMDGVIGSPPYERSINQNDGANDAGRRVERLRRARVDVSQSLKVGGPNSVYRRPQIYGSTPGQIGGAALAEVGETFWSAVRKIIEQCYQVLRPGGVAIWVTKRYVRNKKIVEFSDQWRMLCEAVGFEHIETIRAMQVRHDGSQVALDGEVVDFLVEKKSFFRRNYEKKNPERRIDWEDVIVMRKPG